MTFPDFLKEFGTAQDPKGRILPVSLYPTQQRFAERLYATGPDGRRTIRRAGYFAPKKSGKTGFVGMIVCHHLFFGDEPNREIPIFAWDMDQTAYLFEAVSGLIRRNRVLREWATIGKREIVVEDELGKHVVRRIARDEMGSHGGNPSLVVGDEAWTLPNASMLSALSFSPLRANPLVLLTSYAGFESDMMPGRPLYDWWLKCQPDAEPDPSFLGVWMTGDDARREVPWWTPEWIAEQARLLASEPDEFQRLMENRWAAGARALFTPEQVAALVDTSHRRCEAAPVGAQRLAFVDLGLKRDHTAIVTVHREPNGVVEVDDIFHAIGTRDNPVSFERVEGHLLELHRRFKVQIICDQWSASQLLQRMRSVGLRISELGVSAAYHDKIARNLIALAEVGRLRLYPHEGLIQQLKAVVLKKTSTLSRDDSSVRVRIDSGAGAGVAGKDDLVVALAAAALEVCDTRRVGPIVATITVADVEAARHGGPSQTLQAMRDAKSAQLRAELVRSRLAHDPGPELQTPRQQLRDELQQLRRWA